MGQKIVNFVLLKMSDFTDIGGSEIMRVLKTKKLVGSKVLEMPSMNEMLDAMAMNCCIVCCANLFYCCVKAETNNALLESPVFSFKEESFTVHYPVRLPKKMYYNAGTNTMMPAGPSQVIYNSVDFYTEPMRKMRQTVPHNTTQVQGVMIEKESQVLSVTDRYLRAEIRFKNEKTSSFNFVGETTFELVTPAVVKITNRVSTRMFKEEAEIAGKSVTATPDKDFIFIAEYSVK